MANPFRALKTANRATTKLLRSDTRSDFKVTQQGLDAIAANLGTTQGSYGRKLSKQNAKTLEAMARVQGTSKDRLSGLVTGGAKTVANRYGSAIAGDPELFRGTSAVAKGGKQLNKATVSKTNMLNRAGSEALKTIKAAGVTAASAADFELAAALRERQGADAEVVAAQQAELQQMRLDAKLNESYLRLQMGMENGGNGGQAMADAAAYIQELANQGASASELRANLTALGYQYNLGPAARQKLTQLIDVMTGGEGGDGQATSPQAEAFTEREGVSPGAFIGPEASNALNAQAWKTFDPTRMTAADAAAAAQVDLSGDKPMARGQEVTPETAEAYIAYVLSTWARIAASQGA
jgi:hypothetical protein